MTRTNADPSRLLRRAEFALRLAYWSPLGVWGFAVQEAGWPAARHASPWLLAWFGPAALAALLAISAAVGGARLRRGKDALRTGIAAAVVAGATLATAIPTAQMLEDTRYRGARSGRRTSCLSNVKQLGLALTMYEQDYDGWTPSAGGWNDSIYPYTRNPGLLVCPEADNQEVPSYSLNQSVCGIHTGSVAAPENTVIVFEGGEGPNLVGGPDALADPPRHYSDNAVGFLDGHAKHLTLAEARECVWKPRLVPEPKAGAKRRTASPEAKQ